MVSLYLIVLSLPFIVWYLISYLKWRKNTYDYMVIIPGVPRYPIVGTYYYFLWCPKEDVLDMFIAFIKSHGNFIHGWNGSIPEIHTQKAEHFEIILNNSVHITKGRSYNHLHPWLGRGLLTSTGQKWFQHRKLITPTFHFKILENFMVTIVEKTQTLLKILDGRADGQVFNIYTYITHCTLDVICETAMGVNVNAMSGKDNDYVKAIYNISDIVLWRFMHPYIPDYIFKYLPQGRKYERDLRVLHGFTEKVIADRKKALKTKILTPQDEPDNGNESWGIKKRLSFLDLLLEACDNNKILSDTDIREEVDTFMFEGHDTVTAAMSWNLLLLGNHQDIQEKAYEEIKAVLQNKPTPTTISELNELKYLERVIKESLRLFPSVPFISRQLEQEIQIDEYKIPSDVQAVLHIYGMHRNPDYYPEPEKFDPDRFLPENCVGRHPYAYIPFSAGPRNCIGQKFAMHEEKTILASIINRYKIVSVHRAEDVKKIPDLILRPVNGVSVVLERR
ncbi:Cytochrome P450 [Popillia japonica]|uniref:Cytochrome P450 n=1 Tax=Popillia japonica TaxID=7064 RepID=A0AAW1MDL4_POPJA